MKTPACPRLVLTPGEPAGIGPDIAIAAARADLPAELVLVADPGLLRERAARLGTDVDVAPFDPGRPPRPGVVSVHAVALRAPVECGRPAGANAPYVIETLAAACDLCLDGVADALVTGPVHKAIINEAGIAFSGHTEYLAERTGGDPVMMLTAPGIRVALATTHLPLAQVSEAITAERLTTVIRVLARDLAARFGVAAPRIAVCGLNPHAGEGGHLGTEEQRVITPVLEHLRAEGIALEGPVPADTAFTPDHLASVDAVLAMYHDQGLPVVKHAGFGRAVNVTLGLPIIRTSVDHGTAVDLAGTGRADGGSLRAAIDAALALCRAAPDPRTGARAA